jgi:phenylpropionate dioxygenase-like ring-hydroxylating dioxygenase large terminal subunit
MMTLKRDSLARRAAPMLRDGTTLRDLIDLDRREVQMRVLSDPELYRLELQRIFARAWVGVAHVSELPNVGDFVVRHIGEDRVIVTRTFGGDISVLLNVCAHRGFELCAAEEGNAASFKCPYHGWAFDGSGNLLGAPLEKEMYGNWDKSQYGLRRARVAVRAGIVFATFDTSERSLDEWLGSAGWYIDRASHEDRVPLGPPMRFHVNGNWKTFMDQASGDNYHPLSLHRSLHEVGLLADLPGTGGSRSTFRSWNHVVVSNPEGNATFAFPPGFPTAVFDENADDFLTFEGRLFASSVFPQTVIWGPYVYPLPDGTKTTGSALWQVEPKGPDTFVMFLQNFIDRDAPEAAREIVRQSLSAQQAFVADDYEANLSLQRSARGEVGRQQPLRYFAQGETTKPKGWPGPGIIFSPPQKDDGQWLFWRRWFTLMTDEAR